MRVSSESQYQQALLNIQSSYARVTQLQMQISSGKRLNSASDDPTGMAQVLTNNLQDARYQTDLSMIDDVSHKLQIGVDALTRVQDLLASVKGYIVQANTTTSANATNLTLSRQVDAALDELLQLANQKLTDGSYVFGGMSGTQAPFAVTARNSAGQPLSITYNGGAGQSEVVVSQTMRATTQIAGNEVFQSRSRETTVYSGTTGAAAGTGTDNATGHGSLIVRHDTTSYLGSSGVIPGTSMAADTVIGAAGTHRLTLIDSSGTGASGTVSLNGGPAVAFTSSDTDLIVTGPNGERVHLNTTAITAGFHGDVDLVATGTLSIDGGTTTVPIDFSTNQVVSNPATGEITNVNSTGIQRAGTDRLYHAGTSDLFQTLIAVRETIGNTGGLSSTERSAALQQLLGDLDRSVQNVTHVIGSQSVQAQSLSHLKDQLTSTRLTLAAATDTLESTDTATAIVELQQQMNLYQASLQMAVQLNSMSLLSFLK